MTLQYKVIPLNKKDASYYWHNMRDMDKQETEILGFNKNLFLQIPTYCEESWSVHVKEDTGYKRIACFGFHKTGLTVPWMPKGPDNALRFWFLATDKMKPYWRETTKMGVDYIDEICSSLQYIAYKKFVMIWSEHEEALKWIKVLGFDTKIGEVMVGDKLVYLIRHSK